jgi:hypothetical protein
MGQITLGHLRRGLRDVWDCLRGRTPCLGDLTPEKEVLGLALPEAPKQVDYCLALAEAFHRTPRDNEDWLPTLGAWTDGGVQCQLGFSCRDVSWRVLWLYKPDAGSTGGSDFLPAGVFEVDVHPKPGLADGPLDKLMSGGILRLLDPYACPRLFLWATPPEDEAAALDEWLLQVALWARKGEHLILDDETGEELATLFRAFAARISPNPRGGHESPDWLAAVDTVCNRLLLNPRSYSKRNPARIKQSPAARPGKLLNIPQGGFSAAAGSGDSFGAYVKRAIRGALKTQGRFPRPQKPPGGAPRSIEEAAQTLDVDFSTVWRRMQAGGWTDWCPEAWEQIRGQLQEANAWRSLAQLLFAQGMSPSAARKAVYRARKRGQTPAQLASELELGAGPVRALPVPGGAGVAGSGRHPGRVGRPSGGADSRG